MTRMGNFEEIDSFVNDQIMPHSPPLQIADFGLSNLYHGDEYLQTFCGSPLYASPEIVNGRPYRGPEVDTWSLGVLLYTMVHGTMPFDGNNHKTLVQQISTGNYRKPTNPSGECEFQSKTSLSL